MKNNSILNSLVLAKANTKRTAMALLLGFAIFSLAVDGMTLTARAEDATHAPVQGAWIYTITQINNGGFIFTWQVWIRLMNRSPTCAPFRLR